MRVKAATAANVLDVAASLLMVRFCDAGASLKTNASTAELFRSALLNPPTSL
jgi:hypothetical protein